MKKREESRENTKKILLVISGMTPQVITETLFALCHEQQWIPDEIHLITTVEGKDRALLQLVNGRGYLKRFIEDYKIKKQILFSEKTIHIISDNTGRQLNDLKTPADNNCAADFITTKIKEFTNIQNTQIHVSLAGGRKTMGFYAGYGLSL
ncbi:MAG: TIGR02584 family CRISPR-associated protein, partial [Pseudomonadales bacterium]|nr:TIGR02584 family CRISPR-associated protein [Pseudomonadales bacterium]